MTAVLSVGVKKSVKFNNILNGVNFGVWVLIVIVGLCYADGKNWSSYGFAPYGTSGVCANLYDTVFLYKNDV